MAKSRIYSYKDVDMLMASKTIAESFKANIASLSATNTAWTEQYANELVTRVDSAIADLGINVKKDLRGSTAALIAIQMPARRDLSFFKTQFGEFFKQDPARRDEILNLLGYTKNFVNAQHGNQEALMQLLYAFKTNMTEGIRGEIMAKGITATLIDNIIAYSDTFRQANSSQESFKQTTKKVSLDLSDNFNKIYNEIIGICKIASSYYKFEPVTREQFTFAKIIRNLGVARTASAIQPEPVSA